MPGVDSVSSSNVGAPTGVADAGARYRLISKTGRGRRRELRVPEDVVLLDLTSNTRLEVVRLVPLRDEELGAEFTGIVVKRGGEGVMLLCAHLLPEVVLGCDIDQVLEELPVWVG